MHRAIYTNGAQILTKRYVGFWLEEDLRKPVAKPRIARPGDGDATLVNATLSQTNPNNINTLRQPHLIASPAGGLAMRGGLRP